MQLSDMLHRLAAAFPDLMAIDGPVVFTRERVAFIETLRKAATHAEGLELALSMLEARQLPSIHADALVVGLSTGKVSILPVHRTLTARGFDDRPDDPDVPDRRFGEDRERPF